MLVTTHGTKAFTLIELLISVAIISILMCMLLPVIVMMRRAAATVNCGNNQRQLALGFLSYATDCGDFPSCYRYNWYGPANFGDELGGSIDSIRVFARGPDGTPIQPVFYFESPFSLVWEGHYFPNADARFGTVNKGAIQGCQKKEVPPFGSMSLGSDGRPLAHWGSSGGRDTTNDYKYNTPGGADAGSGWWDPADSNNQGWGNHIGNNAQMCGLWWLGGYATRGATHGYRIKGANATGPGETAMFACPGINLGNGSAPSVWLAEPHGSERWTDINAVSRYGVGTEGQDDYGRPGDPAWEAAPYNRNVAYADGRVRHIVCPRGNLKDQ